MNALCPPTTGPFGWRALSKSSSSSLARPQLCCFSTAAWTARQPVCLSPASGTLPARCRQPAPAWRLCALATEQAAEQTIASEDDLKKALAVKDVVVVDWMAAWCRKCIYLKPKLEKMMRDEFQEVPLVFVDVNKVPGSVVYSNGIRKMPTIAVYREGKKVAEHVAAEGGLSALEKVREMLKLTLMD